jgi:hypothetical protein
MATLSCYAINNPLRWTDPMGLAGLNLLPSGESDMRQAAQRAYDSFSPEFRDGYTHIFAHGGSKTLCKFVKKNCDTPKEIADWLKSRKDFNPRMPIFLWSCNTGSLSSKDGFAQGLSDILGVDVYAPNALVWFNPRSGITGPGNRLPWPLHNMRDFVRGGSIRRFHDSDGK